MSKLKTNIKITLTFIGALVGAGFASGKEIALFFGNTSVLSPVLSGLLVGFFSYVFMELGRCSKGEILFELFGKNAKIAKYIVAIVNLIIFSAMLAAAELSVSAMFGLSGGGLLSGLISIMIISLGNDKIKSFSLFTVPFTILLLISIFAVNPSFDMAGKIDIMSPILYSSFNILTGGFLIARFSKDITKNQVIQISVTVTLIMVTLTTVTYFAVKGLNDAHMPVLEIANEYQLGKFACIIIYLAVLTTMTGTLTVASNSNKKLAILMLFIGYGIALFGFNIIVNAAYPIMGALGIALCVYSIIRLATLKHAGKKTLTKKAVEILT